MSGSGSGPLWVSHRGAVGHAVENTYQAFADALAEGFGALETDLRVSSDEEIVLIHDERLDRLAGRSDTVSALSRRELAAVELRGGARLLFWDQFADAFEDCRWTLDIKPEDGERAVRALARWAERSGKRRRIETRARMLLWRPAQELLFARFFPAARFYAREDECRRAGFSALAGTPFLGGIRQGRTYALTSAVRGVPLFRRRVTEAYRRRGARTVAFLPSGEGEIREAVEAGLDEILIDGPIPAAYRPG